jgi:lipopolysaccharide transport system ATP-binding protein
MEPALRVQGLGKRFLVNELRNPGRLSEVLGRLLAGGLRKRPAGGARSVPDAIWAIRDISFQVSQGEVLGVIGPNGSGKSTLLKVLARITVPTEGIAVLGGRVGALLEVGTGFHPDLSGRENIFLNGSILGMTPGEIAHREEAIIEFAEVAQFVNTPVKHYSSGMFMRLAFAVAAHLNAEIMLVDEVLAVGDEAFREKCKNKMREIARSGRTVLFTSHDMDAMTLICDKAIVLDRGRVVYHGDAEGAAARYRELMRGAVAAAR